MNKELGEENLEGEDSNIAEQPEEQASLDELESEAPAEPEAIQDEDELRARQNGWDPKKGTKTAREFNLTGDLIELKKTIQKRDKDIEEILKYHENTVSSQKQNYRQQLEAAVKQAKDMGDIESFEELHKRQIEFNQQEQVQGQTRLQQQLKQEIDQFTERNRHWYNDEHKELVNEAIQIEQQILSGQFEQQTGIPKPQTYGAVLKQIEYEMKRRAPDVIDIQRSAPRPVISSTRSNVNKSSEGLSDRNENAAFSKLNSSEQAMFRSLKRMFDKQGLQYSVKEFVEKSKNDGEV